MTRDWLCPGVGCLNMVSGRTLCPDCLAHLPRVLHDIGTLYPIVDTHDDDQGAVDDALTIIRLWATDLAALTEVTISGGFEPAYALLIVGWREWTGETLTAFYNAMSRVRRLLARVVNPNASTQPLDNPCWVCMCATLVQHDIGEYVLCLTCHSRWGQAAYQAKLERSGTSGEQRTNKNGNDVGRGTK